MEPAPLVSIVIPVYNQCHFVCGAIDSLLAQSYKNIEIIVVDDGSTDDLYDKLDNYKSEVKIFSQKNMGQSAALNKGWSESTGAVLGYLSADDVLYANCIETLMESFSDKVAVVYCDYDLIDASGTVIRRVKSGDFSLVGMYQNLICYPGVGALFWASDFKFLGGWKTDLVFTPDFDFWLRLGSSKNFLRVPTVLGAFRVHEGSGSVVVISAEKSNEIILLVESYAELIKSYGNLDVARSIAQLRAARSHWQSGRFVVGCYHIFSAFLMRPSHFFDGSTYRLLFGGLTRRFFYRVLNLINK